MTGKKTVISRKDKELSDALLVFKHLDRMGDELRNFFSTGSIQNLLSYRCQTRHLESLLIAYLDEKYYKTFKEKINLKPTKLALSKDINEKLEYYDSYSEWVSLLILFAHKGHLLGRTITLIPPSDFV